MTLRPVGDPTGFRLGQVGFVSYKLVFRSRGQSGRFSTTHRASTRRDSKDLWSFPLRTTLSAIATIPILLFVWALLEHSTLCSSLFLVHAKFARVYIVFLPHGYPYVPCPPLYLIAEASSPASLSLFRLASSQQNLSTRCTSRSPSSS